MAKWESLFERGYIFGDIKDLPVDMGEFNVMTQRIIGLAEEKEKYFQFQNVVPNTDLPHRIRVEEGPERIKFLEENDLKAICSNYVMEHIPETKEYLDYLRDLAKQIIPTIFAGFTEENIRINPGVLLYESGHYQEPHSDGHVGECVLMIYFSDPSTYNGSGKLNIAKPFPEQDIVDSIDPIWGKYVILEQINHNVRHEVEKITGDFKRFGFLAQVRKNDT